ncbi:hypothetical protein PVL29_011984 [Vitis rotundifolia]|uniref:Glycerol kinase n=1 Tax=Vitis rotundifolia TaxID=103349 RepID=A0AA38ZQT2_VITRO|nr:hypothetical protein PVL29_011984 [Vitis rotundifolia]
MIGGLHVGVHVTDVSNASGTMLMNLKTLDWDKPTSDTNYVLEGSIVIASEIEELVAKVNDVLDSMHKDAGEKGEVKNDKVEFLLRVDGGATINNLLMQMQANLLGNPVFRPTTIEPLMQLD